MKTARSFLLSIAMLLLPQFCQAQWRTQTIQLQPGWNAVHLEVQPEPRIIDEVFAGVPVESVWKWDRRFTSIQYTVDPSTLLEESPDWLIWLPASNPKSFLNRLFLLQGNQSYLVKLDTNAAPCTVPIKGRVIIPRLDWYPHGLNLVGFPVNSVNPPTFSDFFRFTTQVDTTKGYANELYRLDSLGRGLRIVQPNRDKVQPGVAYWVKCNSKPAYMSVLDVTLSGGAVDFGSVTYEQELSIRNTHPTASITALIQQRASEPAPTTGDYPELAGPVPLSYLMLNTSNNLDWIDFPAGGRSRALAPGEEWIVRLGVRRDAFDPYTPTGTNGATYQSILEVTDSSQSLMIRVPVVAENPEPGLYGDIPGAHDPKEGLWVGEAQLSQVNAPAYTTNNLLPASPLTMRLLVHVDGYGTARLLQQVALAWDNTITDPPYTNGAYALYADERDLPASAQDVKRISSVAFPTMDPVVMTGLLGTTNTLSAIVNVNFDNPVNPFLHRYAPLHDNKDSNFVPYTNAVEVPNITRVIALSFTTVTNETAQPIWGVDAVAGTYQETLYGLRAQPVIVRGGLALQRISRINQLQGITP
jgi:hypothetical protein